MAESNALVRKDTSEVTTPETTWGGVHYTPRVDICETDDEFVFQCDLPGVKPDDIHLRFEKGELHLHGKVQPRQQGVRPLQAEYGVGDFFRSFAISEDVDADGINAEYRFGVLTVHVPKTEESKPRRILIKAQ